MSVVLLAVAAPAIYWVLGAPLALWMAGERHGRYAWLLGLAVAGLTAELAVIAGVPVHWLLVAVAAVMATLVIIWRERLLRGHLAEEMALAYTVALFAASVSPFPILGSWSGDWLHGYELGRALLAGELPGSMLARPPLFGGAMVPLHLIVGDLASLQVMASVASAGAGLAVMELGAAVFRRAPPLKFLLPLLLSVFFLHHTAAAWSKLMAGGLLVLSWAQLLTASPGPAEKRRSALLFASAVATHEGSIVWAALTFLLMVWPLQWRSLVRDGLRLGSAVLAIAGPFVIWSVMKYGLAARVAANPAISDVTATPLPVKVALVTLSTFIPWSPGVVLARWLSNPAPFSSAIVAREAYWLATSSVTLLAATFVGMMVPALVALGPKGMMRALRPLGANRAAWLWGMVIGTLLTSLLAPFWSADGCMQAAHAPIALVLFALLAEQALHDGKLRRLVISTLCLGFFPFVLLNAAVSAGLTFSPSFEARVRTGSEGDYQRILDHGLQSIGLSTFPWLACVILGSLALWLNRRRSLL